MGREELIEKIYDVGISFEERIKIIIDALTLDEKVHLMTTRIPEIPDLGIKEFYVGGEAAHGIQARADQSFDKGKPEYTTIFTNPIGMSATWDKELLYDAGNIVGNEARSLKNVRGYGSLSLWAPTVDLARDPRWGRNEECYGEDPFLSGRLSSAYINGMYGEDEKYIKAAATLKHFYANNTEENRMTLSSDMGEKVKWEYYLEVYRIISKYSKIQSVMTAYNLVNQVPCMANPEIKRVLKDDFGITAVVCDGGAMEQSALKLSYFEDNSDIVSKCIKAGLDMFTDKEELVCPAIYTALEKGTLTESDLDTAIYNHFLIPFRLGLFDGAKCPYNDESYYNRDLISTKHGRKISLEVQKEAVVLLKNMDYALPLSKDKNSKSKKIILFGEMANDTYLDWYSGISDKFVSIKEGIIKKTDKEVIFDDFLPVIKIKVNQGKYFGLAEDGIKVSLTDEENADSYKVTLWDDRRLVLRSLKTNKFLTLNPPKNTRLNDTTEEPKVLYANADRAFGWFVREVFYFSDEDDNLIGFDDTNASSFYLDKRIANLKSFNGSTLIIDDIEVKSVEIVEVSSPFTALYNNEYDADMDVIAVYGTHPMVNCKEEIDRKSIELSPYFRGVLKNLSEYFKNVNLILLSNYPVGILKEQANDKIKSIIWSATGSEELGNGIADVIFGDYSPAGKLNMTWYEKDNDITDIKDYRIDEHKKTYHYYDGKVLYPFGFGLSYTDFYYSDFTVNKNDGFININFTLENRGEYTSDEVVEVYVKTDEKNENFPYGILKGFERIKDIKPKEKRLISIDIDTDDIRYYSEEMKKSVPHEGIHKILLGRSSRDIIFSSQLF